MLTVTRFALSLFAAGPAGPAVLLLLALLAIPVGEARADSGHPGGSYPLHQAAGADGDLAAVVHLLGSAHGADVNTKAPDDYPHYGETPLHEAAYYGRATIAATLIAAGANVNAKEREGRTPLYEAVDRGHASAASVLLAAGADIDAKDNYGYAPLHHAFSDLGNASVAFVLLAAGAEVNVRANDGDTPLHLAAGVPVWSGSGWRDARDRATIVAALIAAGAGADDDDAGGVNAKDNGGETPLHRAASEGHASVVSVLIAAGANVNAENNTGNTPLHAGAWRASVVSLLLAAGASERSEFICRAAFTPARFYDSAAEECVPFSARVCGGLMNPPKFYDAATEKCKAFQGGSYPLHCAAGIDGDLEAVIQLLRLEGAHKVDVNARDPSSSYYSYWCGSGRQSGFYRSTPLHWAAHYGRSTIAATLIAAGAEVNAKSNIGSTPLHEAAYAGHATIAAALIAAGAEVNAKDNDGETPLHEAVSVYWRGRASVVVSLLLTAGAEVNAKDNGGETPLRRAARYDHASVFASMLIAAGGHWGEACVGAAIVNPAGPTTPCLCESPNIETEDNCQAPSAQVCGRLTPPEFYDAAGGKCVALSAQGCARTSPPSFYSPTLSACAPHDECAAAGNCVLSADICARGFTPDRFYDSTEGECVPFVECDSTAALALNRETNECECTADRSRRYLRTSGICESSCNRVENAVLKGRHRYGSSSYHSDYFECECPSAKWETETTTVNGACEFLYPCHDSAIRKADNSGCECPAGTYAHGDPSGGFRHDNTYSFRSAVRCRTSGSRNEYGRCVYIPDSAECHSAPDGHHAPVAHDLGGWTVAITLNDPEVVSHFIADHGQDPDANHELHLAAANDYHLAATALLAGGADPDLKNGDDDTPLHLATRAGLARMVSILLAADADTDLKDRRGDGALHLALRDQADELVSLLLSGGANPDLKDDDDDTPLHLATRAGLARMVSILLAADADPDLKDRRGDGALHLALRDQTDGLVSLLLSGGANPDLQDRHGDGALHLALRDQADGLVSLLLAADANVNLQDGGGETPLHLETRAGRLEMVSLFLGRGANPDIANAQGETPLHLAARDSAFGIVKLLIDRGANVNATSFYGNTALHRAVRLSDEAANVALVSMLLGKGANPNIRNRDGWRPLDLAYHGGNSYTWQARRGMMAALIASGANWSSECTGGKIPNEHYRPPEVSDCRCPNHLAVDNNGVCECPAETHAVVNGRCLAKGSAQLNEEIEILRKELADLRAALVSLNLRLSLAAAADGPQEELEEVAGLAEQAARGIARRRDNFLALARAGLADADDAGAAPVVGLSDTAATCRMLDGIVEGDARVCSGVDINDTFCFVDSPSAFPCVGLFRHVRRCNDDYNRPALDPFHCAKQCADGLRARGAKCQAE